MRIVASDEQQALEWGREIAERFVARLYDEPTKSWKDEGFAAWIEHNRDDRVQKLWSTIPVVRVGEFPAQCEAPM